MTQLRAVLEAFENAEQPQTLPQMARALSLEPAMLEDMIAYWVRKGRLREVNGGAACTACGHASGCPFIMQMPRSYELVGPGDPAPDDAGCAPASGCKVCRV